MITTKTRCPCCKQHDRVYTKEDFPNMKYHSYCDRCKVVFTKDGIFFSTLSLVLTKNNV